MIVKNSNIKIRENENILSLSSPSASPNPLPRENHCFNWKFGRGFSFFFCFLSLSLFFSICSSICLSLPTRKVSLFGFGLLKAFAKSFTICRVWFLSKKTPTLRTRSYVTKMCLFLFQSLRREIISSPLLKERFQSKENSTYSKIYKQLFETDAKSNSKRDFFFAEVLS